VPLRLLLHGPLLLLLTPNRIPQRNLCLLRLTPLLTLLPYLRGRHPNLTRPALILLLSSLLKIPLVLLPPLLLLHRVPLSLCG
jgi:hypothetical protein